MRGLKTIIFLFISNTFMTFAWYGHLRFKDYSWGQKSRVACRYSDQLGPGIF